VNEAARSIPDVPRPLSLLCELTYRCNLQCPYCYNPLDLHTYRDELDAAAWERVLGEAAELGVLQAHFSGGEPTLRPELPQLVQRAAAAGLYTNLITQGTFLDDALLGRLKSANLDHVQISVQAPEEHLADEIAGTRVHARKMDALRRVQDAGFALTLNCVLTRMNHHLIEDVIGLAQEYGIGKLELANVQFYGWAYRNRAALMPTREQVEHGTAVVAAARKRLGSTLQIAYVLPDYFEERPKPCMHGWGRAFITVTPDGRVLPCPAAAAISTLRFDNVRERSLGDIWREGDAFVAYRGTQWMPDPCKSCDRREIDWGGCRCQAFLLTGDAGVTDPACGLSPRHDLVAAWRDDPVDAPAVPRRMQTASRT
jgi:pyrroloquinoline quinone biosynthesis protein E